MLRRLPTRNDRLQHDVCKAHTGVRKTVSKNVPRRGPILVQTQPTPTSYVRRSRPEIVDLRPDLESLFTLANRRLQPLGHLTATRKLSIRHASNLHSIGLSPRLSLKLCLPGPRNGSGTTATARSDRSSEGSGSFRRLSISQVVGAGQLPRTNWRPLVRRCDSDDERVPRIAVRTFTSTQRSIEPLRSSPSCSLRLDKRGRSSKTPTAPFGVPPANDWTIRGGVVRMFLACDADPPRFTLVIRRPCLLRVLLRHRPWPPWSRRRGRPDPRPGE